MISLQRTILKTLVYADIFDFPLTAPEIHRWLISNKPISLTKVNKQLKQGSCWEKTGPYFHFPHRQKIVKLRRQHDHFSQLKLKQAQKISAYLKVIPFIKLIAITGALAMNNSREQDDIDFIIITSNNRLWLTRLLAVFFLELLCIRRRPKSTSPQNRICLNLFLDESSLTLPSTQRNLYTAHEICQLKPLYHKHKTYQKLLSANSWVKQYLPNSTKGASLTAMFSCQPSRARRQVKRNSLMDNINQIAYKLQLAYMSSRRTRELITAHSAFFHPRPTSKIVLKKYHQRLKQVSLK